MLMWFFSKLNKKIFKLLKSNLYKIYNLLIILFFLLISKLLYNKQQMSTEYNKLTSEIKPFKVTIFS